MKRIRWRVPERLDVPEVRALFEEAAKHYESDRYEKTELALAKAETKLAEVRKGRQRVWWNREIAVWRARLAHKRKEYEKSAEMFRSLLRELPEDDPRYWSCLDWLGHSDWFCERYDEAYKSLVRVVGQCPDPARRAKVREDLVKIQHQRAVAIAKECRIAEALKDTKALLAEVQDEPSRSRARSLMGWLYTHPDVKKYGEAYKMLKSVMETASEAETREKARESWQFSRFSLAQLDAGAGKYDVALKEFDALLAEGVEGRALHSCLMRRAEALIKMQRYRDAEDCYIDVLRAYDVEPEWRAKATEFLEKLHRDHLSN